MANEIRLTWGFVLRKDGLVVNFPSANSIRTFAGNTRQSATQEIGTTHEALEVGELQTIEYAIFKNLSTEHAIEIGIESSSVFLPFLRIKPGEDSPPIPMGISAIYARSEDEPARLDYTLMGSDV